MQFLSKADPELFAALKQEDERQENNLEMIASENFVSRAVLEAYTSTLTNKYAEGYPGKRYYNGCHNADIVETLAIERAKKLFGAQYANVQPHSGAQANMAVFLACLEPGDSFLGMNLAHGGHLTHGSPVNVSGKIYKPIPYGVDRQTETIDYDEVAKLAREHKPKLIVAGASAYARTIDFSKFAEIAKEVGAKLMADIAHISGLVSTGYHPSPVGLFDFVTTTTHKTLRGPRGGLILSTLENEKILNSRVFPGIQGGPLMHVIAAKAVAFKEALQPEYKEYVKTVLENAKTLAEVFLKRGYRVVSGGTDNHLVLLDVSVKGLTGAQAADGLDEIGVTVNKNAIPFDKNPPAVASGIRLGTPALTTRGLKPADMETVGNLICDFLDNPNDEKNKKRVKGGIREITLKFPMDRFRLD
ncbi:MULTISPECIES: serine hydroxymethyltransferase [Leptospira]|uniref:Serine hydroxymethyltransferase n=6 Tax=Leptospira santarosai TaxID=28183 RepID=A0AB73LTU0_9LEPT|nr:MULTISPECIES: serine hydroxymethyltransferase [Leptospira]EMO59835.1 glycine hydroxymethyltransferase [Leptospira santarosai str. CBC1416]ASV10984.1 serine hydroxymethyltransferase [Leptospira santarosai]AVV78869.1 Serine hydroxymethyltransferase [Leptospira santarosai]EKO34220.1 glycine hydroxymethyltransferase [Leptospira santarosai str. MOR084]EKO78246.1 glycine hydroxymethyltransferase [Leptospira sp. Fiocruz LV3954]